MNRPREYGTEYGTISQWSQKGNGREKIGMLKWKTKGKEVLHLDWFKKKNEKKCTFTWVSTGGGLREEFLEWDRCNLLQPTMLVDPPLACFALC